MPWFACNRLRISAVAAENWGKLGLSLFDAGNVVVCDAHGEGGAGAFGPDCEGVVGGMEWAPLPGFGGRLDADGSSGWGFKRSIELGVCLRQCLYQ